MSPKKSPRFKSLHYLLAVLIFLIVADGLALWLVARTDYNYTLNRTYAILQKSSLSLEERMQGTYIGINAILRIIDEKIESMGTEKPSAKEWEWLANMALGLPDKASLVYIDKNADLVLHSKVYPAPRVNYAEREFFKVHREQGTEFYIGPVVIGKISKKYSFSISRRLTGKHGEFLGIILAAIETDNYAEFLQYLDIGEGSTVGVFGIDGSLILRQPMQYDLLGKSFKNSKWFPMLANNQLSGIYETDGIDGLRRLVAYRKIPNLPLIAATTIPIDSILNGWRHRVKIYSAVSIAMFFALITLGSVVRRTTLSEEKEKSDELHNTNVALQTEITERKRAEEALAASRDQLQKIIDNTPALVYAFDLKERFLLGNVSSARLLHTTPKELIGKRRHDFMPKKTADWHEANDRKVMEEGNPLEFEEYGPFEDGRLMTWLTTKFPLRDVHGNIYAVAGISSDITERKQSERALYESQAQLEAALESMMDAVVITDAEGSFVKFNNAFITFHKFRNKDEYLTDFDDAFQRFEIFDEDYSLVPVDLWCIPRALRGETGTNARFHVHRKDTDEWWFASYAYAPILGKDGKITGSILAGRDITDIKLAQDELRKSRDELELRVKERTKELQLQANLLDLTPDSIMVTDMDDRIVFWNQGAEKQYGWSEKEILGETVHGFLHTEFPQPLEEIKAILLSRGRWEGELQHIRKDGSPVTVASRWALQRDEEGKPMGILETNNDVTERRKAEKALRLASVYNRKLIEASLDPLVTIDEEGRISDVNAATEQITGYSRDDLIGNDFSDYFMEPERARDGYRQVFNEGFVRDYPLDIRHRDGHITPVLYNASVYRDQIGRVLGVFAAARDITELKQLEQQLRQTQKLEALGTLAGGIAHDFNNLLGAVIGFTELIQDDLPEGNPGHDHAARVLEAGIRGRDLVKQMLTFSRKTDQEKKLLRLSSIVKESAKLLRASIPTTIAMNVNVKSESGLILADQVQIQQVVMNLCTNAYYAMREKGGTLDVEVSDFSVDPSKGKDQKMEPGLYMKLTVRDTGIGIPAEIKDRIFDPFFTTKKVGEGTGLGLSVVMGIIKQSGGHITVESEPGKGSTFSAYFPKITREMAADIKEEAVPTGTEHVLFVDDEEALLEMGKQLLAKLGYKVTSQGSSEVALALIEKNPTRFDLVITDQTMPDMTGMELAQRILAIRPDMPIVLCTGFSHLVDAESAKTAGIRGFAMKPLTKREIAKTVREVLDETNSA